MAYGRAIEIEGEDGVQPARSALFVIGEGGDTGDEDAAYLILAGPVKELEWPSHRI
jgi:hypothetical protein